MIMVSMTAGKILLKQHFINLNSRPLLFMRLNFIFIFLMLPSLSLFAEINSELPDNYYTQLFSEEEMQAARQRLTIRDLTTHLLDAFRFNKKREINYFLNQLNNIAPESSEYYYFKALSQFSSGEMVRSVVNLEKSLDQKSSFDPAWNLLGMIYAKANRVDDSLDAFKKAVKYSPYNPTYVYNLALGYYTSGDISESREAVNRCLQYKSNFSDAYHLKGKILRDDGNLKESLEYYKKAESYGSQSIDFYIDYLKTTEKLNDVESSLRIMEILKNDSSPETIRILGRMHIKYGEFRRAENLFHKLIVQNKATIEDKKNYLYCVHYNSGNARLEFRRIPIFSDEKKEILDFLEKLLKTNETQDPKDPIMNPAR